MSPVPAHFQFANWEAVRVEQMSPESIKDLYIYKATSSPLILSFPLWLCPGSLALSSSGEPQPARGWDVLRLVVSFIEWCKYWLVEN